jgi:hypothetical protein
MKEFRRNSVDRTSSMVATSTSLNEATIKTLVDSRGLVDENGETSFHVFAEHEEKRLKIIMGFYVRNCGTHRITLGLQMFMMQRFQSVQQSIKPLAVSVVLLFCCTFVLLSFCFVVHGLVGWCRVLLKCTGLCVTLFFSF